MTTTTLGNINSENKQLTGRPVPPKEASFTGQRGFRRIAIVGAAVLLAALVVGFVPRLSLRERAASDTNQLAVPTVSVVSPTTGALPDGLMLPAEVRPWQEASIFSRVNGYLKSWLVDIGAHVEQDQLLAEIDTPDLDHQLEQARSQATLAQGSSQLAKITNDKWQKLWHEGVVSELDADNTATNQTTTKANADAFAANLRVLEQMVAFKRVTAPFPGVITARNTNVGDLIVGEQHEYGNVPYPANQSAAYLFPRPASERSRYSRRAIDRCRLFRSEQDVAGESCDNLGIDHAEFPDAAGRTSHGQPEQ